MLLMIHGYRITPHGELRRTGFDEDRMVLFHQATTEEIKGWKFFNYLNVVDVLSDRSSYINQQLMKQLLDCGVEL